MAQWIVLEAYEGAQGDLKEGQIIDDTQYPFAQLVAGGLLACPYTSDADVTIAAWKAQANPLNTALTEYLLVAGYPVGTTGVGPVPSTRQVIAGAGLTGGGTLAADRTFDVVAGDASLVVSANSMVVGVLQTDAMHGVRGGGTQHAAATAGAAGFATAAQITKLDGIATSATANPGFTVDVGDGVATVYDVVHSLNTRNVLVEVFAAATPWETLPIGASLLSVGRLDVNTVRLTFLAAPTAGQYTVDILRVV